MVEYEHIIQKIITSSRSVHGYDQSVNTTNQTVSELRLTQIETRVETCYTLRNTKQ